MKPAIPTVMSSNKYTTLAPSEQEKYVGKKIRDILRLNTHGITIPEIIDKTPFSRPTVIKHLEKLISRREGYKIKRGNTSVYYPNGKSIYVEEPLKFKLGSQREYVASFVQNNYGDYVFLEERGNSNISGGSWLIQKEEWDMFLSFVKKVDKEANVKW